MYIKFNSIEFAKANSFSFDQPFLFVKEKVEGEKNGSKRKNYRD